MAKKLKPDQNEIAMCVSQLNKIYKLIEKLKKAQMKTYI